MKRIRSTQEYQVFQLSAQERRLLLEVLKLYPLIPDSHASLNKAGDAEAVAEHQAFLREALAEQRKHHQHQLKTLLSDPQWFTRSAHGYQLTLNDAQQEWLLQVLNDIRVGSWLKLGEPEEKDRRKLILNEENVRYVMAMDLCAMFQMAIMGESE
jgi:hypothetical protein